MMLVDVVKDHGFLPESDPLVRLPQYSEAFNTIESIASDLPSLLADRRVRETLASMPYYREIHIDTIYQNRIKLLYSYFASAYVWATHETPANRIPYPVAMPLSAVSYSLNAQPILSYVDYALNNWKRIDPDKPIELDNIELLQNFMGGMDEDWFILVHVDIENKAAPAIRGLWNIVQEMMSHAGRVGVLSNLEERLKPVGKALHDMNKTMDRMTEHCRPDVYFKEVRPYIHGFENIVYEGCFRDKPQNYRGETGAQSSIVPFLVACLGIEHQDSVLTTHLEDMRNYMPQAHRQFLREVESYTTRSHNLRELVKDQDSRLKDCYNFLVNELLTFRTTHFQFAIDYIHKKEDDPKGTGGTPYMTWLKQLTEETEAHLLK